MTEEVRFLTLDEWDKRYALLRSRGLEEEYYGGSLRRHAEEGDLRLLRLKYDSSPAALRLWNFLLTEEERLHRARAGGKKIVAAMKDLGTVPVMAFSIPDVVAFYPDGAWWLPCFKENSTDLLAIADSLGIDESFCPVRAMLGAFQKGTHFPRPDLLICSVGATCDDFSAIAQRLESLGFPLFWWEVPHRRHPEPHERKIMLPGNLTAPSSQLEFVRGELARVKKALEILSGEALDDTRLLSGIQAANRVRSLLDTLRTLVFTAEKSPVGSLEMLIAEMLTIHFCSDRNETINVLEHLLNEARERVLHGWGLMGRDAVKIFWVNPVADLRVMNLLEDCGGRICGTEYLFSHALDMIPEDKPPLEALASVALSDPMVGPSFDRAKRICTDIVRFGAEAVVISRIPGASHCATEGTVIADVVRSSLGLPVLEIEVPSLSDALAPSLRTRLEALVEVVKEGREA